ncbi:MAG: hypothetical protein ACTHW4_02215 [Actinomycetales bacterium]
MANPKFVAKVGEVLGHAPEDAVVLLPRDGKNWLAQSMDKGPKKFSIGGLVADSVMSMEVRPGGHVLGMPFPPDGPVAWALTPAAAVCLTVRSGFGSFKPESVFASFEYGALERVWHEPIDKQFGAVHVTMRDGNHWEFTVTKKELATYQSIEQEINARIQRAGGQGAGAAPTAGQAPTGQASAGHGPAGQPLAGAPDQGLWQPRPAGGAPQGGQGWGDQPGQDPWGRRS